MIRRSETTAKWILISQIEHARLAYVLATHDRHLDQLLSAAHPQILAAICRHDDGWQVWDTNPRLDDIGRPLSFTERSAGEQVVIWSDSIQQAADLGPIGQWMIAEHFLGMRRFMSEIEPVMLDFFREYQSRVVAWLDQWQSQFSATDDVVHFIKELIPFFDHLSLILCCTPPTSVIEVGSRNGVAYRLHPTGMRSFRVEPWPFASDQVHLHLEAEAVIVPIANYDSAEQLQVAGQPCRLAWDLSAC